MKLQQSDLAALHKLSFGNKLHIEKSKTAGCFHCLEKFPATSIKEWIPDDPISTALCPQCGVDAILGDNGVPEFSDDLLRQMRLEYFHAAAFFEEIDENSFQTREDFLKFLDENDISYISVQ